MATLYNISLQLGENFFLINTVGGTNLAIPRVERTVKTDRKSSAGEVFQSCHLSSIRYDTT